MNVTLMELPATGDAKSTFRATTPADASALIRLLTQVFQVSDRTPFVQPAVLRWKYWEPRGDWSEPRSYVLERGGQIVAHAGLWPMIFPGSATPARGIHMIDWAAAPDAPGAGTTILQKLARQYDFVIAIGGSDSTRKVLPAFGFREIARAFRFARPLRPLSQALRHQHRNWKLLPRFVRNTMWAYRPARGATPWRTTELSASQAFYDPGMSGSPRAPEFFEYFQLCPVAAYQLSALQGEAGLEGYYVLGVLRGQARIAGIWLRSPTRNRWREAHRVVQEAAAHLPNAHELAFTTSDSEGVQAARETGFRIVSEIPVYALEKKFSLPANFNFQLVDDDEAFLDSGATSYWT